MSRNARRLGYSTRMISSQSSGPTRSMQRRRDSGSRRPTPGGTAWRRTYRPYSSTPPRREPQQVEHHHRTVETHLAQGSDLLRRRIDVRVGHGNLPGDWCRSFAVSSVASARHDGTLWQRARVVDVPTVVRNRAMAVGDEHWLDGLDGLLADLEAHRRLDLGAPFADGTEAYVVAATTADGTPAVLNLLIPRRQCCATRVHRHAVGQRHRLRCVLPLRCRTWGTADGTARPVMVELIDRSPNVTASSAIWQRRCGGRPPSVIPRPVQTRPAG